MRLHSRSIPDDDIVVSLLVEVEHVSEIREYVVGMLPDHVAHQFARPIDVVVGCDCASEVV